MRSPACSTSSAPAGQPPADVKAGKWADRAYQGWTVAAMLLLLATLWLFW